MLLKLVKNTQKIVDDKAKIFSAPPPKTNEKIKEEKAYSIYKDDEKYSFHPHGEKTKKLQSQLNTLIHKKELKESGVSRPYPLEWDLTPYPERYKPLKLESYDGKGSPSQHLYYFLSQAGHLIGNDPVMTKVFASTLRGPAFTWFMQLPPGTINTWYDIEKQFLARFFEDDTEISFIPSLRRTRGTRNNKKLYRTLQGKVCILSTWYDPGNPGGNL